MDIRQLCGMIADLLPRSGAVGVPGLGSFVIESMPAAFSDKGYTICPPYRRLGYRYSCVENDVLAEHYAGIAGIPVPEAEKEIGQCLALVKKELQDKRSVALPGLGCLKLMSGGEALFVPEENHGIFPDNFGLEPICLRTRTGAVPYGAYISDRPFAGDVRSEAGTPAHPVPEPVQSAQPVPETGKSARRILGVLAFAVAAAVVLAVALRIAATVAPDFVDNLLYSEHELLILGK